jgi:hypothetical protein
MGIITRFLKQSVVHWTKTGVTREGKPTFGTPVQITGRWDEGTKRIPQDGAEDVVATVSLITETVVRQGDALWLGTLPSPASDVPPEDAVMVLSVETTRDHRAANPMYFVYAS